MTPQSRHRQRVGIRKRYHMLLWSYLRQHPGLKDQDADDFMPNIRRELFPEPKRKGWPYQVWLQEINTIWWMFTQFSDVNIREVLWGNPLAGKIAHPENDNPY